MQIGIAASLLIRLFPQVWLEVGIAILGHFSNPRIWDWGICNPRILAGLWNSPVYENCALKTSFYCTGTTRTFLVHESV